MRCTVFRQAKRKAARKDPKAYVYLPTPKTERILFPIPCLRQCETICILPLTRKDELTRQVSSEERLGVADSVSMHYSFLIIFPSMLLITALRVIQTLLAVTRARILSLAEKDVYSKA